MNPTLIAAWTRRRLGMAAGSTLAVALGLAGTDRARAKTKKRKLKRNQFGCVNVGGKCRGKDNVCCSGICQGQKPKPGKPDRSRCVGHDTGGCQPGQNSCVGDPIPCDGGVCLQTTGQAGFCTALAGVCADCRKDTDCGPVGSGTACVVCAGECPETGGRGCFSTQP